MASNSRTCRQRRAGLTLPPLSINGWLRYDLVSRLIQEISPAGPVLEIGAGMGAVAVRLAARYEYTGVEPDPASCAAARERLAELGRGTVIQGDVSSLPNGFQASLVCAFEVLEHIKDDEAALCGWRGLIRPGGTLLLSVPGRQRLFGPSDTRVGHYRRYDRDDLISLLERSGFDDVRVLSYGFPLGYFLHAVWDILARFGTRGGAISDRTRESGRWFQPPSWLGRGTEFATLPFRLLQRPLATTGLGIALVAVARVETSDVGA
jgi:SAM-dependent methyltransferase